jgi:hypothetical protein
MKIRRPSKPEVDFKRKRRPPPQATKLLRYSMLSGLVFIVLLAIVFLPRMFPNQIPVEVVNPADHGKLRFETTSDPTVARLYIDDSTASLELAKFRANLTRNGTGHVIGSLGPGLMTGGNANLTFVDANMDGLLDAGDYFVVSTSATGLYRFEVFQVDVARLAGFQEWGASP